MSLLVINSGSSSLKFGLFSAESLDLLACGSVAWAGNSHQAQLTLSGKPPGGAEPVELKREVAASSHGEAVTLALRILAEQGFLSGGSASPVAAVGHRVVHGGTFFRHSVIIDQNTRAAIAGLSALAPLHNPPALAAIEAIKTACPGVTQVAVFDTAFFSALPPQAAVYPLPYEWFAEWGVRRFGFHGISHEYCATRAAQLLARNLGKLRLVICHLGNGCSASAIDRGRPISTTMGFTPLDGLMMGTRPGSIDPGILLHLQERRGFSVEQLDRALHHESGLLGVSGISSDFRAVEAAAQRGNERAELALSIYASRIRSAIGALTVELGGADAVVFTGGVGENSSSLRAAVAPGLECLGFHLDETRNRNELADADLATDTSPGRILLINTREEWMIARETQRLARPGETVDA